MIARKTSVLDTLQDNSIRMELIQNIHMLKLTVVEASIVSDVSEGRGYDRCWCLLVHVCSSSGHTCTGAHTGGRLQKYLGERRSATASRWNHDSKLEDLAQRSKRG